MAMKQRLRVLRQSGVSCNLIKFIVGHKAANARSRAFTSAELHRCDEGEARSRTMLQRFSLESMIETQVANDRGTREGR